jgi:hypothetical protein
LTGSTAKTLAHLRGIRNDHLKVATSNMADMTDWSLDSRSSEFEPPTTWFEVAKMIL